MNVPWWVLDYAHTTAVRAKLAERLAPATANRMPAALRGVLKASFKLGLIDSDRMTRACSVDAVRGSRVMKGRALAKGELAALFEACNPSTPGGARNAALLGLLYGGGLRRAEAVALDLAEYEATTGKLVVRGKGNKERLAWAINGSRDALDAWLAVRGEEPGALFLPVTTGHASPTTTSRYDRRGERARKKAAELLHVPFVRGRARGIARQHARLRLRIRLQPIEVLFRFMGIWPWQRLQTRTSTQTSSGQPRTS
jgi:site-specific recombinase XerC